MRMQMVCFILCLILSSCLFQRDESLILALELAKDSKLKLEKVLLHYKGESLKLKAAIFLIENMPQYYSESKEEDQKLGGLYDEHEAISQKYGWERPNG